MRAGRLRHRIEIQQLMSATTASGMSAGEQIWSDESLMKIWAGIEPLRGTQFVAMKGVQADITHRVILRYTSEITPKHRIKYRDRIFEIDSIINPDERKILLELMCREKI